MASEIAQWIAALLTGGALLLTGCSSAGDVIDRVAPVLRKAADQETDLARALGGRPEQKLPVGEGVVAVSGGQMGYLVRQGESFKLAGPKVQVPAGGQVMADGSLVVVQTLRESAPQFAAYRAGAGGLEPVDYYAAKAPEPGNKKGYHVTVNKYLNALWLHKDGQFVKSFRVATGRDTKGPQPTWDDYKTNYVTPEGSFTISNLVENPAYTTLTAGHQSYPGGHPENPLGTRWMGFPVLTGDNGGIWAIHGTSEPEKIGTWVSDGCIRMQTKEAEELFAILKGKNASLQVVAR